jgi:cytochrome c
MRSIVFIMFVALAMPISNAAASEELRAYGEYLSSECVTCHQISGEHNGIPSIVGWDAWAFESVMNEYREKVRTNKVMQTIAGALSKQDVKALAFYFGSIEPKEN